MKKTIISKLFILAVLLIAVFFGFAYYSIYTPVNQENPKNISIIIKKGDSVKEIGNKLKNENIIKSVTSFYGYTRLTKEGQNIIAGRYVLNSGMNVPEILKAITEISESEVVLTVQEGLTVEDIDKKMADMDLIKAGEFETAVKNFDDYSSYWFLKEEKIIGLEYPLEGYLYPDTYFLDSVNFENTQLIYKMLDNFEKKFSQVKPVFDNQDRSIHEVITMASILQREVRTVEDFDVVSGILWKRLDSNWHIGADATILYATKKKNIDPQDLDYDSPYNTRLYTGMPPGPICSPDIEHIEAAVTPKESEYWYYLTTLETGEVIYAKTNDEHNINKAKYLY
jgi:UPF0755 protein